MTEVRLDSVAARPKDPNDKTDPMHKEFQVPSENLEKKAEVLQKLEGFTSGLGRDAGLHLLTFDAKERAKGIAAIERQGKDPEDFLGLVALTGDESQRKLAVKVLHAYATQDTKGRDDQIAKVSNVIFFLKAVLNTDESYDIRTLAREYSSDLEWDRQRVMLAAPEPTK